MIFIVGSNTAAYLDQLWVSNIVKTKVINTLWFKVPLYSSTRLCKVVLNQNYYHNGVGQSSFISFATSMSHPFLKLKRFILLVMRTGLGKTGRGAGVGVGDLWVKPGDGELGDAGGNFSGTFIMDQFHVRTSSCA